MARKYEEVIELLNKEGFSALSLEDKKLLKEHEADQEKMVDSDNYTDLQVKSMEKRQESGDKLSDVEQTALAGKRVDENNKLVDIIVKGQNDIFTKHYDYKEDGVSFDIAIKMPNAIEEGAILARLQQYLVGTASAWDGYIKSVYYTIALMEVCGKTVPKMFKDPENIYPVAFDWIENIYNDFNEWQARFRY